MRKIKPLQKGSSAREMLRAIGRDSGFELPTRPPEKKMPGVSEYYPHYDLQKELRNAMLEVEILKAKGLDYRRHTSIR
jgi:hypothetical protein